MLQDPLTGLHSRQNFLALLRQHVVIANERQAMLALIVVDICGFARLNAAHGYEFGDAALKHVAQHLRAVVREQDHVGRIGDNRFALLLTQVMNQGHAELAVQKLFRHLEVPFEGTQGTVRLTANAGAAICPVHASHPEFLMRQAEKSLALARATGQNWLFPPDVDVDQGFSEFWDLEIELDGAIDRGELLLSYQPKLRTSDLATIGAEALMSWPHRTRGLVSPAQFIPIAEKTGQIRPMTMWALNTAMRHAGTWKHLSPLSVAVNVPAELVSREDLPDIVENAMQLWGKSEVQLVLEITERSLVADPQHAFRILSRIRDLGVKISIDDFGTGYSCLAYFKDIPADELKIDKSFVQGMLTDPASADIASLIIDLAHRFGLSVVAEGVENAETLALLRERHCDVVQGHLFAKALRLDAFRDWIHNRPSRQPESQTMELDTETMPEWYKSLPQNP
ncbi:bifunctional diguanylate cyclase/phosphodiesterase [Luteimonas sp. 8-5]|jgi:diguanylate cyclase (GGDEF)-like protein|uniref:putative bifunctional diguanylate cyclase/phosphodiesterase n=1 Tax=Luteimonas sp. 8-5 TaxID=3039387 RepID=UPI002436B8F6|nr:bifunctional diguanylate cyclase/phosphodiesterase [Luteimonas sp. 8-5]MDG6348256.1 bifunctional diguanylate cyclase/phosphodiesterase [Luteimonas sp. 8-5]